MRRGTITNLLLAGSLAVLAGMTAFLSAFPVNRKVVDNETAVKQNEQLVSLQRSFREELLPEKDESGLPMLYLRVPEERAAELLPPEYSDMEAAEEEEQADPQDGSAEEEPEPVPAWAALCGEELQESYAQVLAEDVDEDGFRYALTLKEINRKGRLHNNNLALLGFDACAKWVLESRDGSGLLLPLEDGTQASAAVHLMINGTDMGRCLLSPVLKEDSKDND